MAPRTLYRGQTGNDIRGPLPGVCEDNSDLINLDLRLLLDTPDKKLFKSHIADVKSFAEGRSRRCCVGVRQRVSIS